MEDGNKPAIDEGKNKERLLSKSETNSVKCKKQNIGNSLAMPVISYSFGIVEWIRSDLQKTDRKTSYSL